MALINIGANTAASVGIAVTSNAAADTLSTGFTVLSASTAEAIDKLYLQIKINTTGSGRNFLLNLYTGAAASETLLITVPFRLPGTGRVAHVELPLHIDAGTRVTMKCQDSVGSGSLHVSAQGQTVAAGLIPTGVTSGTLITDQGSGSNGLVSASGNATTANTTQSTQLIASTAADYNCFCLYVLDGSTTTAADALIQLTDDGSVFVEHIMHKLTSSDGVGHWYGPFYTSTVAAGSNISVTVRSSSTTTILTRIGLLAFDQTAASGGGSITIGGGMDRAMKDGETTAARKRVFFDIRDSAGAGWSGSVTGVKAKLSISGAAAADSTNDIVRVTTPLHYVELDNTEAGSAAAGDVIQAWVPADTGRLASTIGTLHIVADDPAAAALTAGDIADAVVEGELDVLETYDRTTNTAATMTGPSGVRTLTIGTDAAYEPVASIS